MTPARALGGAIVIAVLVVVILWLGCRTGTMDSDDERAQKGDSEDWPV